MTDQPICHSRKSRFHERNKFRDFGPNPRFSEKSAISRVFLLFSALLLTFSALFTQYTVLSMILLVGYFHSTQIAILSSVETSVSITNERSIPLTSKLSSELTSFIDVANMIF